MTDVTGRTARPDAEAPGVQRPDPTDQPDPGGNVGGQDRPQARHRAPIKPARQILKVIAGTVGALLVLAVGAIYLEYRHLDGNLRSMPLFGGLLGSAGTEKKDPFGHTPINLLVIGSDSRSNAADCAIGHDCGPGANADVELIVHVSADRSNATVMSIPRDTMTQLPGCRDPQNGHVVGAHYGQINSSLDYGPGCTVAAVHQLTGIPIDHFAMLDFVGVIAMSDAVGGVPVCVSDNVYDPYSHLKLARGTHVLKGMAALQFVRSRHSFGDGSDLGRTYAQHAFLSSMIRTLKGTGVITDPGALLSLADAATKALTVDSSLGSVSSLISLAGDVNQVPSSRITFTTMPNGPDPADPNRIVPAAGAQTLFDTIANDQSLSAARHGAASPAPTSSPTSSLTATQGLGSVVVRVENGTGITGRAAAVAANLIAHGASSATTYGSTGATAQTRVEYDAADEHSARAVAAFLHLPDTALAPTQLPGVTVIIGTDWPQGVTYSADAGAAASSAAVAKALPAAHAQTADGSTSCTPVSSQPTVLLNGVAMTPSQAFDRSPSVPFSAP